jgi:L-iditol 2-dehydrogenase
VTNVEIPETLSFEEAALAEPLACVFNAFEKSKMRLDDTVLIIGAGPIGLMHAKMAQTAGVEKIIINDLISSRTALAEIQSTLDNISQARSLKSAIYFE